jgi:maltose O-acetyltransferase
LTYFGWRILVLDHRLIKAIRHPLWAISTLSFILRIKSTQLYWRIRLAHLGEGAMIYPGVVISFPKHVRVGAGTSIAGRVVLHAASQGSITIGQRWAIAAYTKIITPTHDPTALPVSAVGINRSVTIGDDVWIGTGAIMLPGVTIGDRSIVAAGAVVTRNVPSDVLDAGVPARIVKQLLPEDVRRENGRRALAQKGRKP